MILTPTISILSGRARSQAERDVNSYIQLLRRNGGDLGDETIDYHEAQKRLLAYVRGLYQGNGRTDFWPLQSAYNMGTGTKIFSLHGREATLVNGVTWGVHGCGFPNGSAHISLPTNYLPKVRQGFAVFKVDTAVVFNDIFCLRTSIPNYWLHYTSSTAVNERSTRYTYRRAPDRQPTISNPTQPIIIGDFFSVAFDVGYNEATGEGYDRMCENGEVIAYRSSTLTNPLLGNPIIDIAAPEDVLTRRIGGLEFSGVISMLVIGERSAPLNWMHGLFRDTLGQELELP